MKIGANAQPFTGISGSNPETIIVRGHDLVGDLMGHIGFTEHVWLLIAGARPTETQRRVLDAALVSIAEHGLVPSVVAARMTLAAAPEALQGAVAAGLLGCGSVILGSSQSAGDFLAQEAGAAGPHAQAVREIEAVLPELTGRPLLMNISGAIPAVLLDAGFPQGALKGVPLLARTASLIGHLLEEQLRPIGFAMAHAASASIAYDGPAPAGFVAAED